MKRSPERSDLLRDRRGAVMVVGLSMACFLIGSLWFLIGIGDAIVFRDRMQEASDHAVFSSAVVHARGMNFIAALNLVMYAITAIWLLLCIFDDLLDLAHIVLEALSALPYVGSVFAALDKVDRALDAIVEAAMNVWEQGPVKIGLPACATIQSAAAIGYPWYGEYATVKVGKAYKQTALSVSPSMFPGNVAGGVSQYLPGSLGGSTSGNTGSDSKLGLPVVAQKMDSLCEIVGGTAISRFMPSGVGAFLSWASPAAGSALKNLYCTGSPWNDDNGPKAMWTQAKNGNDWMQVWGIVLNPKYKETSEKRVRIASRKFKNEEPMEKTRSYFAQAEFYFDCEEKWEDDECNGDDDVYHNAIYEMKWRARLRRVRQPDYASMIAGYVAELVLNPKVIAWAKGTVADSNIVSGSVAGLDIGQIAGALLGWGIDEGRDAIVKGVRNKGGSSSAEVIH